MKQEWNAAQLLLSFPQKKKQTLQQKSNDTVWQEQRRVVRTGTPARSLPAGRMLLKPSLLPAPPAANSQTRRMCKQHFRSHLSAGRAACTLERPAAVPTAVYLRSGPPSWRLLPAGACYEPLHLPSRRPLRHSAPASALGMAEACFTCVPCAYPAQHRAAGGAGLCYCGVLAKPLLHRESTGLCSAKDGHAVKAASAA